MGGEGSLILSLCEGFLLNKRGYDLLSRHISPISQSPASLQVIIAQSLTKESILICVSTLKNPLVTPAGLHEQNLVLIGFCLFKVCRFACQG